MSWRGGQPIQSINQSINRSTQKHTHVHARTRQPSVVGGALRRVAQRVPGLLDPQERRRRRRRRCRAAAVINLAVIDGRGWRPLELFQGCWCGCGQAVATRARTHTKGKIHPHPSTSQRTNPPVLLARRPVVAAVVGPGDARAPPAGMPAESRPARRRAPRPAPRTASSSWCSWWCCREGPLVSRSYDGEQRGRSVDRSIDRSVPVPPTHAAPCQPDGGGGDGGSGWVR